MLSPPPERSGRAYSSPPATKMHQCARSVSAQACLSETQRPRLHCRQVTGAPSAWCAPILQTPRRKAGVRHKPYCLHKQSRHSESPLSVSGNTLRAKFPDASQGPTLPTDLSEDSSFKLAMLTIFWRASYLTSWDLRNIMVWNEEDMDTIFPTYNIWEA